MGEKMSNSFEEWFENDTNLAGKNRSTAKLAWNAALLHAAEIAMNYGMKHDCTFKHSQAIAAKEIAAKLRKEATARTEVEG